MATISLEMGELRFNWDNNEYSNDDYNNYI